MEAPAVTTQPGRPSRAFSSPLRRVPRKARLMFLVAYRSVAGFLRHDGLTWSAAMAFWLVLSLPPLLIALSSLATSVLGQESARTILAEQIGSQLPTQSSIIGDIVEQEISVLSVAGLGSLLFLLFSGSRVFASLVNAINTMWRHVEDESFLRRQLLRIVMVAAIGALLVASVLLQLGIYGAREDLGLLTDVLIRFVLPFALVVSGLFVTYWLIPRGKATWRTALVGAIIATVLLRLTQLGFWFMLTNFIDFDTGYGPLAGIAVLMTWAVVASAVVLIGAELVAAMDRHHLTQVPLPSSSTGDPSEEGSGAGGAH